MKSNHVASLDDAQVDVPSVAERLDGTPCNVSRLMTKRRIPFAKLVGCKVHFSVTEYEQQINDQRVVPDRREF